MSVFSANITLGTAPTLIVPSRANPQSVVLHNMSKVVASYVYLGGSDVSTENSIHLDPGDNLYFDLGPGDDLWAVSDPAGIEVGILGRQK